MSDEPKTSAATQAQETYFIFKEKIFDEKKFSSDDEAIKAAKKDGAIRVEHQNGKVVWTAPAK